MEFSNRLRKLRESRGLSMRQLAKRVGVAETTYREWEYGRAIRGEPYVRIAQALGISLEELFGVPKKESESAADIADRVILEMRKLREIVLAQSKSS